MIEIKNNKGVVTVETTSKNKIIFDTSNLDVKIDDLEVNHPGEFEKAGILLEVKEYASILFYSFTVDSKHLVIVPSDTFDLKEEILSFFGDVDALIITGTQKSAKIFESIEARLVVPYGPEKHTFLTHLGQHTEEVNSYKVKGDFSLDTTEFVNLSE